MSTASPHRVLVLFGSIPLYGQERGNIEAVRALTESGTEALFVTHEGYGHETIQPHLDRLGLAWTPAAFPGLWSLRMGPRRWAQQVRDFVAGNVGNERFLMNLLPAVWWLRLPLVFRLGDEPRQHRWPYRALWRWLLIPAAEQFVCVSEYVRASLLAAGAPPERVRVIYSHPSARADSAAPVEPAPDGVRTVLYVGQLTRDKGVDLLVQAAMDLCAVRDDVRFVLAGDYSWQNPFAEGLIETVRQRGLADRIVFTGYVSDIPQRLAAADVHACPSVWEEPLSNTLVEAKAAGTPSVIFRSGGLPELVTHGVDGYVCPEKTADALRAGIEHFLDRDDDALRTASDAARRSLATLGITRDAFARAWQTVYDDAAGRSAALTAPAAAPSS
jgi:glycosyltransferase involved in cell wall biosynthesis